MKIEKGMRFKVDTYEIRQYPERVVDMLEVLKDPTPGAKLALCHADKLRADVLIPKSELTDRNRLPRSEDLSCSCDQYGYMLKYRGRNIGGVCVLGKPKMHWRHARANVKEFGEAARQEMRDILSGRGQERFYNAIAEIDAELSTAKRRAPKDGDSNSGFDPEDAPLPGTAPGR